MKTLATLLAAATIAIAGGAATATGASTVNRVIILHTNDPATDPIKVDLATDTRFTMRELLPHQFRFRVIYGDGTRHSFTFDGFTYMTVSRVK